jgi:lipoate---protein ligase
VKPLHWTDSGLRNGLENAALDRCDLATAATAGEALLPRIRFWSSTPTASLGAHQAADQALRLDFCRAAGIAVIRRVSGGGAIYLDRAQQGFTFVARREELGPDTGLPAILQRCAEGLIHGLADLGIPAQYEWPNDIEVGGRKIGSFFAAAQESAILIHGSLLLDADVPTMLKALRAPTEKLSPDGLASARDRLVSVQELLGQGVAPTAARQALLKGLAGMLDAAPAEGPGETSALRGEWREKEAAHAFAIDWSERRAEAIEALLVTDAGPLQARASFTAETGRLAWIEFASDGQCSPGDLWKRLAGALPNTTTEMAASVIAEVFSRAHAETIGFSADDVARLVAQATDKHRTLRVLGLSADEASTLMIHQVTGKDALGILGLASVVLIPYCAKPVWCEWRHQDECAECGLCAAGEAYRLARERGLRAVTVTDYEHLVSTLAAMRDAGDPAYVGMCCRNFYVKRFGAFRDAGLPALLMDISGANCYELQQEDLAYAGRFAAQAELNEKLLQRVMQFVPPLKRRD